ncbi:MAG: cytochrome P450 [Myxococcota bacterium]
MTADPAPVPPAPTAASAPSAPVRASADARGWDVYAIALEDDPHPRWRALRETAPVLDAGGGVYFVTRWDLVDEILRDPRHRAGIGVAASFGAESGVVHDVMRSWLMSLDGPPQQRARDLVRREFTPRKIEGLRPLIEAITGRLVAAIEAAPGGGAVDLVPALAFALPSEVIRSLFGIPLDEWTNGIEATIRNAGSGPSDGIAMIEGLARDFDARLRAGRIPDGLLAQLCRPDPELGALSPLEVVANSVLLVTAAIDTTAGLIGNAIACLLERPALLERVRREPALVAAVVEETLRFEPSALSCSRTAGVDLVLEGVAIPAGSQLLLGLAAANRDPHRFPEPDRFDVDRDLSGLVSFGGGRHFCLGAALARLEARVVLERLLVTGDSDYALASVAPRWQKRNPTIRGYDALPVLRRPRTRPVDDGSDLPSRNGD